MRMSIEDHHQKHLIDWARVERCVIEGEQDGFIVDHLFAIPNGGGRSKTEGALLKKTGVKAGVSDLFLSIASGGYNGLYVEMKKPKDLKPSTQANQKQFLERRLKRGYAGCIAFGSTSAMELILAYLQGDWGQHLASRDAAVYSDDAYG
ncbi:VRR-NUC domain-containing protein [Sinobacterium caligoides]|uniref:VRR-NUC domain-containing protein n=1 Tax=Sinobacterium caligoides TaxID=933926 RepID=A0A3N2E0W0_9GAMM|nr:VRR-NUC domain-containing protein [Sinobacterium caligoides]ROS05724.1 VRR-NUC domain-containing protein [Sinobacterium caligoides]